MDTMKPEDELSAGMWRFTDQTGTKIGKVPSGDDALWAFIERADARFGIVEDTPRWAALRAAYGLVEESRAKRLARAKGVR